MQQVFKYSIPIQYYFSLELPQGARILTVQAQQEEPQIWALVNPKSSTETRNFRLAETGHPIEEDAATLNYIGTFQAAGGSFIGHVFEIIK